MKKLLSILLAVATLAFGTGALAADTIKGVNQNGHLEVVGIDFIASVKYSNGKVYYRSQFDSSTSFYLEDANASQYNTVLQKFGSNAAANSTNGWVYNLAKVKVKCDTNQSVVFVPGMNYSDPINDGCAFWQVANGT